VFVGLPERKKPALEENRLNEKLLNDPKIYVSFYILSLKYIV